MKKVLVTGAAGFLGYYIARALSARPDHSVYCIDNFIRGEDDALYEQLCSLPNVFRIDADLTDGRVVADLPSDVDVVFHMAALNGTQNFYERPFDVVRCCTLPTIHLLDHYAAAGRLERFVYAGTSEAYASTVTRFGWAVPTDETVVVSFDDLFNPRWSYGASKMHGEVATISACRHYGVPFTIARFHNAYGPRMGNKHVIPDFLIRGREGRFELFGHADTRAFIYAEDAARATIALAKSEAAVGEIVNVGGSLELTMHDLAKRIMQVCGWTGDIVLHPSPAGSVARRAPKLDKLRALTGFDEQWALDDGLRKTAEFYL